MWTRRSSLLATSLVIPGEHRQESHRLELFGRKLPADRRQPVRVPAPLEVQTHGLDAEAQVCLSLARQPGQLVGPRRVGVEQPVGQVERRTSDQVLVELAHLEVHEALFDEVSSQKQDGWVGASDRVVPLQVDPSAGEAEVEVDREEDVFLCFKNVQMAEGLVSPGLRFQ